MAEHEPPPLPLPEEPELTPVHALVRRDLTGRTLASRYLLVDVVGGGGMGTVYSGIDLRTERKVAVKVLDLRADRALDPMYRERFAREARLSTRLSHRNIVEVFEAGESDGVPFIVMELLTGSTLARRLDDEGALPAAQAITYFRQMCEGLAFAHDMGLIHRDLKPANCFLEGERLKLLDFGLAKVSQPTSALGDEDVTRTSVVMGSPAYMAPEQARGEASARSDIYSLGVIFFRMLTGQLPFQGRTSIDVIVQHIQAPVPWFEELAVTTNAPVELELVVRRCLEKDPRGRYATVVQLLEGLAEAEYVSSLPPSARRATRPALPRTATPAPPPTATNEKPPPPVPLAPPPAAAETPRTPTEIFSALQPPERQRWPWVLGLLVLALGAIGYASWPKEPTEPAAPAPTAEPTPDVAPAAATTAAEPTRPSEVQFRINSIPAGATVKIGRKKVGVTPLVFELPADAFGEATAELTLELKGYQTITFVTTSMGPRFDLVQRLTKGRGQVVLAAPQPEPVDADEAGQASAPTDATPADASPVPAEPAPLDLVAMSAPIDAPAPEIPAQVSKVVVPPEKLTVRPRLLSAEAPRYSSQALAARVKGVVVVRCLVTVEGLLTACKVVKSLPLMDDAVLESMSTRRYAPGEVGGRPVATELSIPVRVSP